MPVPVRTAAKTEDRQECLSSTETTTLPKPQLRIAAVSLAPAPPAIEIARFNRVIACVDVARARVEARMALAELRGTRTGVERVHRIVVVMPDLPEPPPDPATL